VVRGVDSAAQRRRQIRKYHETGLSNRAIGRLLGLNEKTVRGYLRAITRDKTPAALQAISPAVSPAPDDPGNVVQLRRTSL
jgi:DNA-binding NarL/FixJ family response regulator